MFAQLNLDEVQRSSDLPIWHLYVGPAFFINATLKYLFPLAGLLLLANMIIGGFQLMFARGDPKAMQGAQGKITTSLIGFVIIIFAYFLIRILIQVFGLEGTYFGETFK